MDFEPVARRSSRIRAQQKSVYFLDTPDSSSDANTIEIYVSDHDISDTDITDPGNSFSYRVAVSGSDSSLWFAAM